jgi:uncharacterized membrane protein AbrB (regulator of aidB expression)
VATARVRDEDMGVRAERVADRTTGVHDETKWAPLTTEFWAMVALIAGILIAAAATDSLDARGAWLLVAIIGTGYIVSRGMAKAGTFHEPGRTDRRR